MKQNFYQNMKTTKLVILLMDFEKKNMQRKNTYKYSLHAIAITVI